MNKLRLIKIYEIRGKIHPIEAYIIDLLHTIVEVSDDIFIHYKKGSNRLFAYGFKTQIIYTYTLFKKNIKKQFKFTGDEMYDIIKYLLEKHLNLIINIVV